ncbi:MAG: hypothetical protein DHS20C13_09770 [Thermodesulfobacteriota bacterium]|nr:MAG: hypothetical protein DHS20C13_09770 [Thermodesulfobacteriota bacterium]
MVLGTLQTSKKALGFFILTLFIFSSFLLTASAQVELIENGDFETGDFTGWIVVNEPGGSGDWFVYTGTTSPASASIVLAPPVGDFAAIADSGGPGSHLLYQDIDVPAGATLVTCSAIVYYSNSSADFIIGPDLSFAGPPNQQARIDLMDPNAPDFDIGAGVLENLFQTMPGDPDVLGYTILNFDLTDFAGTTVRFRAAEVDNQFFFQFMVDDVTCEAIQPANVPTLSEWGLIAMASILGIVGFIVMRRRQVIA